MQARCAIFPGTFDPITNGHIDLIQRCMRLFSHVIVAVAANQRKQPYFEWQQRIMLAQTSLTHLSNVSVKGFSHLLIDFAHAEGATAIIRGVRGVADFEYEFRLAGMNRHLAPEMETIFLLPAERYAFVSSSFVTEIAQLGGDVTSFVPIAVKQALEQRFTKK